MMFRRLYWVTEKLDSSGSSVCGVYTSIPDLVERGLCNGFGTSHGLRLSLVKLDDDGKPLGVWQGEDLGHVQADLAPYITTGEFSIESAMALQSHLQGLATRQN